MNTQEAYNLMHDLTEQIVDLDKEKLAISLRYQTLYEKYKYGLGKNDINLITRRIFEDSPRTHALNIYSNMCVKLNLMYYSDLSTKYNNVSKDRSIHEHYSVKLQNICYINLKKIKPQRFTVRVLSVPERLSPKISEKLIAINIQKLYINVHPRTQFNHKIYIFESEKRKYTNACKKYKKEITLALNNSMLEFLHKNAEYIVDIL